jgi:hypothetical protein
MMKWTGSSPRLATLLSNIGLDDTDDAVMPKPADSRTMVSTPSVLAMVPTPSAVIDDTTTVREPSVTTRAHAMVQDP